MCGGTISMGGAGGNMGMQLLSGFFNSIGQTMQQQQAYDQQMAQIEMQKRRMDDEYQMRVANAILNIQHANSTQQQANDAASLEKSEVAREMLRAREAAKASAAAAGVAGNTLNRLVSDISVTEQQKLAVIEVSRGNTISEQQMAKQKAYQSTKMSPFRYYVGEEPSFANSMFSLIPSLFGSFSYTPTSCAPAQTTSVCR